MLSSPIVPRELHAPLGGGAVVLTALQCRNVHDRSCWRGWVPVRGDFVGVPIVNDRVLRPAAVRCGAAAAGNQTR